MKIYQQFKETLSVAGEIKIAWFTTYNFHLYFFEKYILSALANRDPQNLKNLKDYEALNVVLHGEDFEDKRIDVRVFHDFRAMRIEQAKKTCLHTYGINPAEINSKYNYGVFHPKVCLIINKNNEGFLMTGSANLSLSAWSKQSECITIKRIEDRNNALRITKFFTNILNDEDAIMKINEINDIWQTNLKTDSSWEFQSSFENENFIGKLNVNNLPLHIWSPYFSDEINNIIDNDLDSASEINIIPDLSPNKTIRINDKFLNQIKQKVNLLSDDYDFEKDNKPMVHAKVWLTPEKIAIGSWNFTHAGINKSINRNNIEAGIIQNISKIEYNSIIGSCDLKLLENYSGLSESDINDDREKSIYDWKMSCQIYADWNTFKYRISSEQKIVENDYFIDLPGKNQRIELSKLSNNAISFFEDHKVLLKDRIFTVYNHETKGERVYLGVIIELNSSKRPVIGFDSFNEFMRAWIDGKPENKSHLQELNYNDDLETEDVVVKKISNNFNGDYSNPWFSMFLSLNLIRKRIEDAKMDTKELSIIGYHMPGSVTQLREHLEAVKEMCVSGASEMSKVFLWFLINEGNAIIKLFNDYKKGNPGPKINKVINIDLKLKGYKRQGCKWLDFIEKECKYSNERI